MSTVRQDMHYNQDFEDVYRRHLPLMQARSTRRAWALQDDRGINAYLVDIRDEPAKVAPRKPDVSMDDLFGGSDHGVPESTLSTDVHALFDQDSDTVQATFHATEETAPAPRFAKLKRFGKFITEKASVVQEKITSPKTRKIAGAVGALALTAGISFGLINQSQNEEAPHTVPQEQTQISFSSGNIDKTPLFTETQLQQMQTTEFAAILERPDDFARMMHWVEANPGENFQDAITLWIQHSE